MRGFVFAILGLLLLGASATHGEGGILRKPMTRSSCLSIAVRRAGPSVVGILRQDITFILIASRCEAWREIILSGSICRAVLQRSTRITAQTKLTHDQVSGIAPSGANALLKVQYQRCKEDSVWLSSDHQAHRSPASLSVSSRSAMSTRRDSKPAIGGSKISNNGYRLLVGEISKSSFLASTRMVRR